MLSLFEHIRFVFTLGVNLMASNKTEKTWDDLQESFNRIRQQLGLVPWTHQSDRPKSQLVRQKVHSPSYLPRLVVTSDAISKRPVADLRRDHWVVVPPLYNNRQVEYKSG